MQTERQKWRYRERHAGRETEMKLGRPSLQLCGQTDKENEGLTTETKTKRTKASLQTHTDKENKGLTIAARMLAVISM